MASVRIYASCNNTILNLPGLKEGVGEHAAEMAGKAERILTRIRATTQWDRIDEPSGQTYIDFDYCGMPAYPADWKVELHSPNPIATEFGHEPSGYFAGTKTRSPEGLYILYKAAGYM